MSDDNKKKRKDPRIESESWEEIELTDPITGLKFMHKVLVKKYKPIEDKLVGNKGLMEELEDLGDGFQLDEGNED